MAFAWFPKHSPTPGQPDGLPRGQQAPLRAGGVAACAEAEWQRGAAGNDVAQVDEAHAAGPRLEAVEGRNLREPAEWLERRRVPRLAHERCVGAIAEARALLPLCLRERQVRGVEPGEPGDEAVALGGGARSLAHQVHV